MVKKYVATPMAVGLVVIVIAAISAGSVAVYLYSLGVQELQQHLQRTLDDSIYQFKSQLNQRKTEINYLANRADVKILTEQFVSDNEQGNSDSSLQEKFNKIINDRGYVDYKILDLQGKTILNGKDSLAAKQGKVLIDSTQLQQLLAGTTVVSHPFIADYLNQDLSGEMQPNMLLIRIMVPIKDGLGSIMAILNFKLSPDQIFSSFFHYNLLGLNSETYAINQDGLLLTPSKFTEQLRDIGLVNSIVINSEISLMIRDPGVNLVLPDALLPDNLQQQPLTRAAQSLVQKQSGIDLQGYRDYRGVEVIGAWKWDDQLQMGFITETDKSDAFVMIKSMLISAFFSVLFVIIIVPVSIWWYRHVSQKQMTAIQLRDAMVNHSAEGVILIDQKSIIQIVNPALCQLFGYTEAELIGCEVGILLPEAGREQHLERIKHSQLKALDFFDLHQGVYGRKKDGSLFSIEISVSPMAVKNQRYFIGIVRDITEKVNNERMLIKAKEAAELASNKAEQANQAKSQFLSKMSHELRTPLNAILGFSQILELDELDQDQLQSVTMIKNAGLHLLNLINDILDLARIESGQVTVSLEHIELKAFIESLKPLVQTQLESMSLTLSTEYFSDGTIWVEADQLRLKQVMLNLLSNAIKYNKQGGTVAIFVSQQQQSKVRISIQDSGLGMDEKQMSQLFEPFNRLNVNETIEGTGIGLVISSELLKLMNSNIGVESVKDVGSTFWIELNVLEENKLEKSMAESVTASEQGQDGLAASPSTISVLYVEDNPANLMVVRALLKRYPQYQLLEAMSAEDGLDVIRQQQPNIVLMDINLPGMSGFEALEVIKQENLKDTMKIIALSANAMNTEVAHGVKVGFDEYLTKPIDFELLISTLDKLSS
ncbi:MAG: PAS domain S-box protein [Gammaproteobacteria bacterium]|nr:PAS domain S-box protein [Gammaproteobacteria bacterium]